MSKKEQSGRGVSLPIATMYGGGRLPLLNSSKRLDGFRWEEGARSHIHAIVSQLAGVYTFRELQERPSPGQVGCKAHEGPCLAHMMMDIALLLQAWLSESLKSVTNIVCNVILRDESPLEKSRTLLKAH